MTSNSEKLPAKRKRVVDGAQITFITPVAEAAEALQNAEHEDFVTKQGLQKFVSLKWADDSVREEDMLEFVRSYDRLSRTTRIAGEEVDLSSEKLKLIFCLPEGITPVERWVGVHTFVSKFFPQSASRRSYHILSRGNRVAVERVEFLRTAIHIMVARPNVCTAWAKQVEDFSTCRKWSDYFAERFHEKMESQGSTDCLLGSHIRIVIKYYQDEDQSRIRKSNEDIQGKKKSTEEQLPERAEPEAMEANKEANDVPAMETYMLDKYVQKATECRGLRNKLETVLHKVEELKRFLEEKLEEEP